MSLNFKKIRFGIITLAVLGMMVPMGCQPEDSFENNGLADTSIDATFSITPVDGAINRYVLESKTTDVIASKWNIGEGEYLGNMTEEIFLPDAGTYTITHVAIGRGGATSSSSQELVVEQSDPNAGNIVQGGKFENEDDFSKWTILNISASGAAWTFSPGGVTISASGWNQQGIFQAIEVQGNKNYRIDMTVSTQGSANTWFEVYASTTPPVQDSDYSGDVRMGLNTWAGCGTSVYSGKLSAVSCTGSGNVVSFEEDTTIYLIIKCGGENVGEITVSNVEMRGTD